jgi:hypothetical protein
LSIAALVMTVTACGVPQANAGGSRNEPALGTVPRVDSYDDVVFPLDSYHPTMEQRMIMSRANDVLVRDCMRRYGFEYDLPERTGEPALENRVIGVVDKHSVARNGYKPDGYLEQMNRVKEAKSKLNGDGQAPINGVAVPDGRCSAEVQAKLGVNRDRKPGDENFLFILEGMSSDKAEADSRLKAAFGKWSRCMDDAGFDYRDPLQANGDPDFAADVPTQVEIDTATADVACRTKHNVNGIWVAVRSAYQNQIMTANADELRQHQTASADQLQNAMNVLSAQ